MPHEACGKLIFNPLLHGCIKNAPCLNFANILRRAIFAYQRSNVMKISGRNFIPGTIVEVKEGATTAHVRRRNRRRLDLDRVDHE